MVPIEIFGEPMRTLAHVTPHAWAIEGFRALLFEGGDVVRIAPQLGVLGVMAVALITVATVKLRRQLVGG
jgi:ABC-2 type transport system permease protein